MLLHVIFSSHLEWKEVWHKLPEYHLLIPDLPCHSQSKGLCKREDFSIELCADHVANMIRKHAHDGRAHLVGISAGGGWTVLEMVRRYPELVKSAYASGAWPYDGLRLTIAQSPRLVYAGVWTVMHSPGGKNKFFAASGLSGDQYSDKLFDEIKGNMSSRLAKAGFYPLPPDVSGSEWLGRCGQTGVRLMLVAGGAYDDVAQARKAGQCINAQEAGRASLYVFQEAGHAWNLQFPAVFAKSIQCWVEGRPMPAEFEQLI